MKIKLLFILLLGSIYYPTNALETQYSFVNISTSDGLVNNQINSIFKDSRGFIWIGTPSGLSRYDGVRFRNFTHDSSDSTSLIDNYIENIQELADGDILLQTRWQYTIFDIHHEKFMGIEHLTSKYGIGSEPEAIYVDKDHRVWFKISGQNHYLTQGEDNHLVDPFENGINRDEVALDFYHDGENYYYIYESGVIECFNEQTNKIQFRETTLEGNDDIISIDTKIYVDNSSDIWIYGNNNGISFFESATKKWQFFSARKGEIKLSSNLIRKIIQDKNGNIWIGTDHGGIDLFDKKTRELVTIYHHPEDQNSLAQNSITDIFIDDLGVIWIGTYKKGVSYYHESIYKFPHYRHLSHIENSLPYDDVNCFVEDSNGNLWIGTNGDGLIYFDRSNNQFSVYQHEPQNTNSLSNDIVVSLFIDHEGLLWIGTFTGGLNTFDGKRFKRYRYNKDEPDGLPNDNIWTITEDDQKRIWVGTLGGGIVLFNKKVGSFQDLPNTGNIKIQTEFIGHIQKMKNGNMFIGTGLGIYFYDMAKQRIRNHPYRSRATRYPISNDNVNDVYEDSRGLLWVATREGLTVIDPETDSLKIFNKEDALAQNIMNCVLEDNDGAIWVSKSNGLSRIEILDIDSAIRYQFSITNFGESDGLQGEEFNVKAKLKTSKGELIFGGPNGFNLFQPRDLKFNDSFPEVVFTDFLVFNRRVVVDEKIRGKKILTQSISSTNSIKLRYSINVFTLEFAALNFIIPDKVQYKYILEGFDEDWVSLNSGSKRISYTNLNPGEYTLKVKASNSDGIWNDDSTDLQIIILPPFYRSNIAYFTYTILLVGLLLFFRYAMLKKQRLKFEQEQEQIQTERHQEMDEMKLKFLTNVSHEFRTPLTLILAPLEKMMKTDRDPNDQHLIKTIDRNARQLLDLVNQLLDFRKLELNGLKYNPSFGDIVSFLQDVCDNFSDSFKKKGIKFGFVSNEKTINMHFDHEKLQKVMMNLLSNALKFTLTGQVTVSVKKVKKGNEFVLIKVKDSGIGISKDEKEKIFDRFYQSKRNQIVGFSGSGIGLNLAREMVLLHQGTIEVESDVEEGATFLVKLPLTHLPNQELSDEESLHEFEIMESEPGVQSSDNRRSILLVEDNLDFRHFMKETLSEDYHIFESGNGEEALDVIHKNIPDLVISDVMMPVMDGLELCKQIKKDPRTSHIPVVLLTARTADEDKISGLEIGADDYITKPFNMDLLIIRIQNLVEKQKKGHDRFKHKLEVNPSEIEISSIDEKLIKKAIALVEDNISVPKYSVEDLSHELGMSRVYLYKKLLAITGKTPIEFIRVIRLKRAASLLQKSQMTVAEVAYDVGFNSPRYFSKYFQEEFGVLPSEYLKSVKSDSES